MVPFFKKVVPAKTHHMISYGKENTPLVRKVQLFLKVTGQNASDTLLSFHLAC